MSDAELVTSKYLRQIWACAIAAAVLIPVYPPWGTFLACACQFYFFWRQMKYERDTGYTEYIESLAQKNPTGPFTLKEPPRE